MHFELPPPPTPLPPTWAQFQITVGTYDIDVAGIVSNIVYHRWLEDLRMATIAGVLSFEDFVDRGLMPTLVRTEIDYRRSIRHGEAVVARGWVRARSARTLEWNAEIWTNGQLAAQALQIGVLVDIQAGKAAPLPTDFVTGLGGHASTVAGS
jgi:acyl-CoA thioester hydrolase